MSILRQKAGKVCLTALLVLSGAGLLLGQTAPGGGTLGVDTTGDTSASTAGLAAIWGANIPGGMAGVQNAVNMGGNTTAGTLPPAPDPYQRDASGNLVLDATGKPVKKPADQLAKETAAWQALCDQIKAAAALAASLSAAGQPGGAAYAGGISVSGSSISSRTVPLMGPNWGTSMALDPSSPLAGLVGDHANLASAMGRPSGGGLWTAPSVPDVTAGGSGQGIGQTGGNAVAGLLGGAPTVPVIGNPSNPIIVNMPVVCVCCGAAISQHRAVTSYKTYYGVGYGMLTVDDHADCFDTPCNTTVCNTSMEVIWDWFGPGADSGFAMGSDVMDSGCRDILFNQGRWNANCPNFRFVSNPVEIPADIVKPLLPGYSYYSCAGLINEPVYGSVAVCDNGHRQDWPCGPGNHGW